MRKFKLILMDEVSREYREYQFFWEEKAPNSIILQLFSEAVEDLKKYLPLHD